MPSKKDITDVTTVARDCIAMRVRRINRVVSGIYDEALRPLGIKVSQMNLLVATAQLGLARPPQLCRILQMDASTLSRNVDRMRARGWLEVVEDQDARAHPFRLTAKGSRLLQRALPVWESAQRKATALLGQEAVHTLVQTGDVIQEATSAASPK